MINYAVIAFILAFTGVYSLSSYFVTQGHYEIGIRLTFGATKNDVLRLFLGPNSMMAALGVCIGLVASISLARIVTSLLYSAVILSPILFGCLALLPCSDVVPARAVVDLGLGLRRSAQAAQERPVERRVTVSSRPL